MQSDFDEVYKSGDARFACAAATPKDHSISTLSSTIYGRKWLVQALDEAQDYRNLKGRFFAASALRAISSISILMTATPVTSKIMDLWNLARLMNLAGARAINDPEAVKMNAAVRNAKTKDHKRLNSSGMGNHLLMATASGVQSGKQAESLEVKTTSIYIAKLRMIFAGCVIRRDIKSLDNAGQPISGLRAFNDLQLVFMPYAHEIANLETLAASMVANNGRRVTTLTLSGVNSYLTSCFHSLTCHHI